MQAVDRLGQQPGNGGLARAARAGKQVCMPGFIGGDSISQRLDNMLLAEYIIPAARPPFSIECLSHIFVQWSVNSE